MKNFIFSAAIMSAAILFASACEQLRPDKVEYSDLTITEFHFEGDINGAGQTVSPIINYSYIESMGGNSVTKTDGASVSFESSLSRVSFLDDGRMKVNYNPSLEPEQFSVTITVSIGDISQSKQTIVTQLGCEDYIIDSKTIQLPIKLAPHTCVYPLSGARGIASNYLPEFDDQEITYVSNSPHGLLDKDPRELGKPENIYLSNYFNCVGLFVELADKDMTPEFLSASGAEISISGGEVVTINRHLSGKIDTTVIEKPVYYTKGIYGNHPFGCTNGQLDSDDELKYVSTEESFYFDKLAEAQEQPRIEGNTWIVPKLTGPHWGYLTLGAKCGDKYVDEIILGQNQNWITHIIRQAYLTEVKYKNPLDDAPTFDQYPVGANPQWKLSCPGLYYDPFYNGDLFVDSYRTIRLEPIFCFKEHIYIRLINGEEVLIGKYDHIQRSEGCIADNTHVKLSAEVPTSEGTKHVEHLYEWNHFRDMFSVNYFVVPMLGFDCSEEFYWDIELFFPEGTYFGYRTPEERIVDERRHVIFRNDFKENNIRIKFRQREKSGSIYDELIPRKLHYGFFDLPIETRPRTNPDIIDGMPFVEDEWLNEEERQNRRKD